jgi:hypothetical protein
MIMAGHQPNYLPWLGFFDKMRRSDVFVIEDNVQFEHKGFTNRNKIKEQKVSNWLTVPVEEAGKRHLINQIKIARDQQSGWRRNHWLNIKYHYSKAPYWAKYSDFLERTYNKDWILLIDINMHLIEGIMGFLGITTPLILGSSLNVIEKKSDLVLSQCKAVGADVHLAGQGAKGFLDVKKFERNGVKIVFQEFEYPEYRQLHGDFIPNLSVLDYLFCTGGTPWYGK